MTLNCLSGLTVTHYRSLYVLTSSLYLMLCMLVLGGCERTECMMSMTRCADDGSATLRCERGQWVIAELCEEGAMCMNIGSDDSSKGHTAHTEESIECSIHSESHDSHSVAGDSHSVAGDSHSVAGDSHSVAGDSHSVAGAE